jgi:hypothetical protein
MADFDTAFYLRLSIIMSSNSSLTIAQIYAEPAGVPLQLATPLDSFNGADRGGFCLSGMDLSAPFTGQSGSRVFA